MSKTDESLKDDFAPESLNPNWRSRKYQRTVLQIRMEKEKEWIKKDEDLSTRQMGKDQEKMRKCLEKLELDKKKILSHGSQQNIDDREKPTYSRGFSSRPSSMRERRSSSRTQQEGVAASADPRRSSIRKISEQVKTADQGQETQPLPDRQSWRHRSLPSRGLPIPIKKKSSLLKSETATGSDKTKAADQDQETQPLPDRQSWRHRSLPSRGLPIPIKKKSSLLKSETATGSDKTSQDTTIPFTTSPDKGRDKHIINQERRGSGTGQESRKSSLASNPSVEHEFQVSKHGHRGSLCKESSHSPRKCSLVPGQSQGVTNILYSPEAPRWYDHALKTVMEAYKETPQTHGASPPGETQAPAQEEFFVSFRTKHTVITAPKHMPNINLLDSTALDDLRELLTEARIHRERMPVDEYGNHSQNRMQRRRVESMRDIFIRLGKLSTIKFDPLGMLSCRYLRLTEQNEETLAEFAIESGEKPGIHAHSKVPNCDILEPSV